MHEVLGNLFSSFDPRIGVSYRFFSLWFWGLCFLFIFPVFVGRFVRRLRVKVFFGLLRGVRMSVVKGVKVLGVGLLVSVFFLLVMVNLFGLVPWVFSLSSHLVFTVSLGFPLWLGRFILTRGLVLKKISRLVGSGLPLFLAPVIGIFEVSSQFVRPVTLSLRLAANIIAGHVIIALLIRVVLTGSVGFIVLVVGIYLFEMAICIIQSFVFVLLLGIYVRE